MKKFIVLISCVIISTNFSACSLFSSDSESDVQPTPTPVVSESPDISDDDTMTDDDKKEKSLEDYANTIKETYGDDYIPNHKLSDTEIRERLEIDSSMYDDIYVEGSSLDENPDIFIAVKAKDGMVEKVEQALKMYKEDLKQNTLYSANSDKIDSAQVYTNGNYVFFMIVGANEFVDMGDDMAENFKDEMQKGLDALKNMFE